MYNDQQHIFSVTELNQTAKALLEECFTQTWVEGEISNFICPASGHWYFSLKDDKAQIRCAMFRQHNLKIKLTPEHGMHVLVKAKVSLYAPRGDYQLIVESLEEVGFGALQRAFEQLKTKLQFEGLFDAQYKKPLPRFPQRIGIITSPTGAAIKDILHVLKRRFPCDIIIYPTLVQGELAAAQITKMLQIANQRQECDLLILARGGGSLEDLWPFNEETVARAIFASKIPIIAGIGHEIDFTIVDFVADVRAPTPSAAAEIAVPDKTEISKQLANFKKIFFHFHPIRKLQEKMQLLDRLQQQLYKIQQQIFTQYKIKLQHLSKSLNTLSPLATLQRGYSIITNAQGKIVRKNTEIKIGEKITAQLAEGEIKVVVTEN
jgi:exodeoxyribonuclease VII large subunit